MTVQMTDFAALRRNRMRARPEARFLFEAARDDLHDRLSVVNREFRSAAIVTGCADLWRAEMPRAAILEDTDTISFPEHASHDLVLHSHCLHWSGDPVGQMIQCRRAMCPDGLFLASFFGGRTLFELRESLTRAEAIERGGVSPRVAPMADVRDAGALLQRAGFALPVADVFSLTVMYRSAFHLMRELRHMGEANALHDRLRRPTGRAVFERAAEIYETTYGREGRVPATFDIVVLTGWSPAESQPRPLRPGSATARLADALGADEHKLKR